MTATRLPVVPMQVPRVLAFRGAPASLPQDLPPTPGPTGTPPPQSIVVPPFGSSIREIQPPTAATASSASTAWVTPAAPPAAPAPDPAVQSSRISIGRVDVEVQPAPQPAAPRGHGPPRRLPQACATA